ncbi:MAG: hypothetical protein ACLFSA_04015 [Spirochaetaceae bacterium]
MRKGKPPEAKRGGGFLAPNYKPYAGALLKLLAVPYLKWAEQVSRLDYRGMERLAGAYRRFEEGEERLVIMFRHAAKEDAPVMVRLILRELPLWCRKQGIPLERSPHVHFLYGKDVLNWAGASTRWLFPRIGGIPVVNTRLDRESQETIRRTLVSGRFPLAFAPEGQVSYHMFKTAPLVPGAATLPDWAYSGLMKEGKSGAVTILPISIGYLPERNMEESCRNLEEKLAEQLQFSVKKLGKGHDDAIEGLSRALIEKLEAHYASDYPGIFNRVVEILKPSDLQERYNAMCETVLRCAEASLGRLPAGTTLERIFGLRFWVMESFQREDIDPKKLSPLDKNRADYRALQALVLGRHIQLADILEYIDFSYLDKPGLLRRIEFLLNLLDVVNRFEGGNINSRFTLKKKGAHLLIGKPLRGDRTFVEHPESRKKGREALTRRLREEFTSLESELEGWMEEG